MSSTAKRCHHIPKPVRPKQEIFTQVVGCNGRGLSRKKLDLCKGLEDKVVQLVSMGYLGDLNQLTENDVCWSESKGHDLCIDVGADAHPESPGFHT